MPRHSLTISKKTKVVVPRKKLEQILSKVGESYSKKRALDISLVFLPASQIKKINKKYRGKKKATDVLSFNYSEPKSKTILGEILIEPGLATKQAKQMEHGLADEISVLFLHGLLHVVGFDHEKKRQSLAKMSKAEQDVLASMPMFKGLKGIIVRSQ